MNTINEDLLYARNHSDDGKEQNVSDDTNITNMKSIIDTLDCNIDNLRKEITVVIDKKIVSYGIWNEQMRLVEVISNKNLKQYLLHYINKRSYLYPFEALFMVECRSLIIMFEESPLSIEDSYKLLLQNQVDCKLYRIFSLLSKSGYHVKYCKIGTTYKNKDLEILKFNTKHEIEDKNSNIYESNKKSKLKTVDLKQSKCINYKVVTSIRPLTLKHLRNLSKTDKKLWPYFMSESNQLKSILYCVKESIIPVEMNKNLLPLHGQNLKPLIDFSSIYDTEQLFNAIQRAGPKSNYNQLDNAPGYDLELLVDFEGYPPKTNSTTFMPLFRVIVVNVNDSFPSFSAIKRFQTNASCPLFFALVSDSLEFNFYGFENFEINDEYPNLWENNVLDDWVHCG